MTQTYSVGIRTALKPAEYRQKEVPLAWQNLLGGALPEQLSRVKGCRTEFSLYECPNGHRIFRASLCKSPVCYVCSRVYTEGLVEDTIQVMSSIYRTFGAKIRYGEGELTVPRDLWDKVGDTDLRGLRRMGMEVLKQTFGGCSKGINCDCESRGMAHNPKYEIGGNISVHFWHSSNPFAGWYPHIHYTLFDLAYDRQEHRFVQLKMYLSGDAFARLRARWKRRLEEVFGDTSARDVDIHFHYQSGIGHLRHRVQYQYREPVIDFYKYATQAIHPVDFDAVWVRRALLGRKHEKHIVWFGWLADCVRYKYLDLIELELPRKKERDKERKKTLCPLCGLELEYSTGGFSYEAVQGFGDGFILGYRPLGGGSIGFG